MAIPRFDEDLAIISKLGDNPGSDNNLTTDAFRAKFDEGPQKIQEYLNEVLIPAAEQSSSPQEGLKMEGPINMNGNRLNGIAAPENLDDAVNLSYVKQTLTIGTGSVTLSADRWEKKESGGFTQTVTAEGVGDADQCHVFVSPQPSSYKAYMEASAFCVAQAEGTLTFECENIPDVNLLADLIIFGGHAVTGADIPMLSLEDDESGYNVQAVVGDEIYGINNATVNQGATSGNYDFTIT